MSGAPALQADVINRATRQVYTSNPGMSQITLNTDMRTFTGSFDFEFHIGRDQKVDLRSHDFVEFYYVLNGSRWQVGVGFIETIKSHARSTGYLVQANGRDLLGQLIDIPYSKNFRHEKSSMLGFVQESVKDSYVIEYLKLRNRSSRIVDRGAYKGALLIANTAEVKRGAVLDEYAELAMNRIYLDRLGRVTIYGRSHKDDTPIDRTLRHEGDLNVIDMVKTDDFSAVYSEVTVAVVQGEFQLDRNQLKSRLWKNTDPRVSHIFRPYSQTFSTPDLVKTSGEKNMDLLQERLAKSIIRKSNQHIGGIVVQTNRPFYQDGTEVIPYEIGQNWKIKSLAFDVNKSMKLVGIGFNQSEASLGVQLAFVEPDTVV